MLQSGDWVVPRLYDEIRANKPPLIYCAGDGDAIDRRRADDRNFRGALPSTIAMLLTLTLLAIAIGRHIGGEQAPVDCLCHVLLPADGRRRQDMFDG